MKSPSRSRFYPLYVGAAAYLLVSLGLRILLRIDFAPAGMPRGTDLAVFLVGLRMDLAAAAWIFLPMVVWLTVIPDRLFLHPVHRALFIAALAASVFALVFTTIAEWNFFDEFNARFNTVAVDYLIYPQEVFVNLWDSYPVGKVLLLCASLAVASVFAMRRLFRDVWDAEAPIRGRIKVLAIYVAVGVVATRTVAMKDTRIYNRVASEISSNGAYSFVYAATTRHLDYPGFYRTIDRADAFARTKRLVSEPNAVADAAADSIRRHITSTGDGRPKNVVILLIESFGSEFWGSLGRPGETLTPEMDKLSQEGLLFTSLYASGNRTVRGMEGVLASFPPLPGDSIVKRNQSDHVATLARTLKAQGYNTLFIYGGRGVFDGMRSFTTRNGYDRFIEQKDFKNPTFTTIWGVCDEDLYRRGVEELRALHDTGKPFFVTMLSVSNHKPYTYPKGRIPEDPDQHARPFAVKYTDWSL
ncbi:MAG: sulfatase-like hydrolase/transferase, partial [Elusimicrobia bacterium]|nr:sulfatase-like hydrolase/transferase [Elusimicrobiota bacterium]